MICPHLIHEHVLIAIGSLEPGAKLCMTSLEIINPLQHWKRPSPQSVTSLLPGALDFASMQNSKLCKTAFSIGPLTICASTIRLFRATL